jgi:hypothetical protein
MRILLGDVLRVNEESVSVNINGNRFSEERLQTVHLPEVELIGVQLRFGHDVSYKSVPPLIQWLMVQGDVRKSLIEVAGAQYEDGLHFSTEPL